MCDVHRLTGAWLPVWDCRSHTHTPKGLGGRRGSHKASNSPSMKLELLSLSVPVRQRDRRRYGGLTFGRCRSQLKHCYLLLIDIYFQYL